MIGFDIHFDFFFQPVGKKETIDGFDIEIILMLGRLMRFWFDKNVALETDFMFMLDDHLQEAPELCLFLFKVGIEQAVIAFTTTPQHIVRTA